MHEQSGSGGRLAPASPRGPTLKVPRSRAHVGQHEVPGQRGAILLVGDALGQNPEPGTQGSEPRLRGSRDARGSGGGGAVLGAKPKTFGGEMCSQLEHCWSGFLI